MMTDDVARSATLDPADDDGELAPGADALSLDELKEVRTDDSGVDFDPNAEQIADIYEELRPVGEDFVLPQQPDEFVCGRCFLVLHKSRRVADTAYCRDCA